jgi:hypothetical protein
MDSEPVRREQIDVGRHTVGFESPDLIVMTARGDVSLQDAIEMIEFVASHAVQRAHLFCLVDLTAFKDIAAEARKAIPHAGESIPYRGMALYGASFQARIVAKLAVGVSICSGSATTRSISATRKRRRAPGSPGVVV